jgi:threonine synthase
MVGQDDTEVLAMAYINALICSECQNSCSHLLSVTLCPSCGGHLEVTYDYEKIRREFDLEKALRRPDSIWRWRELLPVADPHHIVTLGEGGTPLQDCRRLAKRIGVDRLLVKNEAINPTASFKDRSFSVAMSKAVENGIKRGFTRSSGNAGASFAAYAAAAGFNGLVLVNAWATQEKLSMIQAYGQQMVKVDYKDSGLLREMLDRVGRELEFYDFTKFINPFRNEGLKTYAYEIALQMEWDVPDRMVFPTGSGGGIYGSWKGFNELKQLGLIKRFPKMTCIQSELCAPIVKAYKEGKTTAGPHGTLGVTIAQSMASNAPIGGGKRPLKAIYDSKGCGETVTDDEILEGIRLLGEEGIFAEPASAAPIAAVKKLRTQGTIDRDETVVCIVTASGLKQTEVIPRVFNEPTVISMEALENFMRAYVADQ